MRKGIRLAAVAAAVCGAAGAARADTFKAPTEAFPTIQSAIDEAGPGDTVLILPGTHDETLIVEGKDDLTIKGKGNPVVNGVLWSGGLGGSIRQIKVGEGMLRFDATTDVSVSWVEVFSAALDAMSLEDNTRLRVSKVRISGAAGDGIHDEGSIDTVIEKCLIQDCDGDGIDLSAGNAPEDGSDGARVSKNRIVNCEFGVNAGGDGIVVEKNRIEETEITGIHFGPVTDSGEGLIVKNRIGNEESPLVEAIQVFGQGFDIWSNTAANGGILEDGQSNRLERNKVSGADTGIRCDGQFTTLYRNNVRNCDTGIDVRSPYSTLDYNRVSGCSGIGILVTGDGNVSSYRNQVTGTGGHGIFVQTDENFFLHTSARGSGTSDLTDSFAPGVNTYTYCRFGTVSFNL